MSKEPKHSDSMESPEADRPFGVEAIQDPALKDLFSFWKDIQSNGHVPGWHFFDPSDFKPVLPRLAVVGVEYSGAERQFRYRLAGYEIVGNAGRDPTGKTFQDLYEGDYLDEANTLYNRICDHGQPYYSRRVFPVREGFAFFTYDRLILPFSTSGKEVDRVLLAIAKIEHTASTEMVGSFLNY